MCDEPHAVDADNEVVRDVASFAALREADEPPMLGQHLQRNHLALHQLTPQCHHAQEVRHLSLFLSPVGHVVASLLHACALVYPRPPLRVVSYLRP